jgi:YtcA family
VNPRSESSGEIPKLAAGSLPKVQERWSEHRMAGSIHGTSSAVLRKSLVVMANLFLAGCGSSHHRVASIDVFGSYFPAWLLSLAVGVVLTIIAAGAGRLMEIRPSGLRAPILCVSLILIFSISIWFWFFAS